MGEEDEGETRVWKGRVNTGSRDRKKKDYSSANTGRPSFNNKFRKEVQEKDILYFGTPIQGSSSSSNAMQSPLPLPLPTLAPTAGFFENEEDVELEIDFVAAALDRMQMTTTEETRSMNHPSDNEIETIAAALDRMRVTPTTTTTLPEENNHEVEKEFHKHGDGEGIEKKEKELLRNIMYDSQRRGRRQHNKSNDIDHLVNVGHDIDNDNDNEQQVSLANNIKKMNGTITKMNGNNNNNYGIGSHTTNMLLPTL